MRILSFVVAVAMLSAGCGRYFAPDRNVKRPLKESDVVGVWKLTPETLSLLKRDGYVPPPDARHTIQFNADGTMAFASVIDYAPITYFNVSGSWKLEHDTANGSNIVTANSISLNVPTPGMRYGIVLNFTEDRGHLQLWSFHGDPDSWEFLEYDRVP